MEATRSELLERALSAYRSHRWYSVLRDMWERTEKETGNGAYGYAVEAFGELLDDAKLEINRAEDDLWYFDHPEDLETLTVAEARKFQREKNLGDIL